MKLYIETYGCQMNERDSGRMAGLLAARGYERTEDPEAADLILVNTCSIREKAANKVFSAVGRLLSVRKKGAVIGVAGCVAQQEGEKLAKRLPEVGIIFGTRTIHRLPELVEMHEKERRTIISASLDEAAAGKSYSARIKDRSPKALVTIMEGCNNFCSFCIVPYVRGREFSRPWQDVVDEIGSLAAGGVREVTLIGQNVNSYRSPSDGLSFAGLISKVAQVEGIGRIRFTTSHPKDLSDELISMFASEPKLCEHIHLPLQSGSDVILKAMNRGYTASGYMRLIESLRRAHDPMALTTDLIVGFPGETEADFKATLDMVRAIGFHGFFSFKFSPRPGTAASKLEDSVPLDEKARRLAELQEMQKPVTLKQNRGFEGRSMEVLVESTSRKSPDELTGRTRTNHVVNFPCERESIGKFVTVVIERGYANSLRGRME
jgi:tRNA-2-methylthio-N6-dimethylallyladenosine synthase